MKFAKKIMALCLAVSVAFPAAVMAGEAGSTVKAPEEQAAESLNSAKIFETQDGVLSIEAPKDNGQWAVIQDDQKWFSMSDGTDTITVEHYANGDVLPAVVLAKAPVVQVYQVYYSTENEVFIVTGQVTKAEDMPYVRDAVNSFKVLKFDTKKAAQPKPEANYGLRNIGSDMYCITTDGVNIRESYSTDSPVIGGLSYKDKVYVVGEVTKDGADTGWLKIRFGNIEGYAYDQWFDVNNPAGQEQSTDPYRTGDEMMLFREDGENTIVLYLYSDGQWRDDNGRIFTKIDDHTWDQEGHGQYFWYDDVGYVNYDYTDDDSTYTEPYPTGDEMMLFREDGGNTIVLYYYSDGQWRDDNGRIFTKIDDHTWDQEGHGQYFWYDDVGLVNYE